MNADAYIINRDGTPPPTEITSKWGFLREMKAGDCREVRPGYSTDSSIRVSCYSIGKKLGVKFRVQTKPDGSTFVWRTK